MGTAISQKTTKHGSTTEHQLLAAIQQLVQSKQALMMALQAVALAGGASAPLSPQPPVAVQFVEALALANVDTILDYSTNQGVAISMQAAPHFLQSIT